MSAEVISLIVLVLVFLVASVRSVNMGALALVAAAIVGATVYDVGPAEVLAGFPGNLFVILVGVTYLFALAKNNGTVDWIVHASVRAVGGRVALIPWAMFAVCAAITAIGAITPAAVAIVAPVALGFARRMQINPVLIGILVVMGATAGSFSPIGIFGAITNGVVEDNQLPGSPLFLFIGCFVAALLISIVVFFAFGGRELLRRKETAEEELATREYVDKTAGKAARTATRATVTGTPQSAIESTGRAGSRSALGGGGGGATARGSSSDLDDDQRLNPERILTLIGLVGLAVGAFAFNLDVGFMALGVAVTLTLTIPGRPRERLTRSAGGPCC